MDQEGTKVRIIPFADALGIVPVVLVALDEFRRHELHLMSEVGNLARPMMRTATRFCLPIRHGGIFATSRNKPLRRTFFFSTRSPCSLTPHRGKEVLAQIDPQMHHCLATIHVGFSHFRFDGCCLSYRRGAFDAVCDVGWVHTIIR